ncbi:nucleotidyl transferase AbiEii/AbiGii toxin family protein [Nocardiopsis sp. EMB25]|uniref:nucleotidyl transferase AbiEii/AbiGii toxin family protein n=1 Tax=Nocardiopsis sp. EMB25 TaxID=2835867 RepID=UPI002283711D|nr:nucleotidyl transferase AbiEii/AbiGii toxin family protein [Nocardiopsis sp. EMB25]MCY9786108.1 nucleotidyl transferase AbiEii/AbiGii toxin family protein [Nocardiopsis sp. EMB25]
MEFPGDFETHLTLDAPTPARVDEAAAWARENGLKFTHIELDRGASASQPMVTYHGHGTLSGEIAVAEKWTDRLAEGGFGVTRAKIEVSQSNVGVPRNREEALALPAHCYFEHHIKLLLAPDTDLDALSRLVEPHLARFSRNARRVREDGYQERFVTQRCSRVGLSTARALLDQLQTALREEGLAWAWRPQDADPETRVLGIEREFVVYDSALGLDAGWMDAAPVSAGAGSSVRSSPRAWSQDRYPDTYLPNTAGPHASQEKVFDPALKQYQHAYRPGEPVFDDPGLAARWWNTHRCAMEEALAVIAGTRWRDHLVLRGSMLMPMWVGDAARRARDLDFVVVPADMEPVGEDASRMLDDLVGAFDGAVTNLPGLRFHPDEARTESIWTYERAEGRRIVLPWSWEHLPKGTVQVDIVFHEPMPEPPVHARVGSAEVLAASPELSLAWKVLWLYTDGYPQGKDLYDAVLLAENSSLSRDLLMRVLGPVMEEEMGVNAEEVDERFLRESGELFAVEGEWAHFVRECPWVEGGAETWLTRFETAVAPSFRKD